MHVGRILDEKGVPRLVRRISEDELQPLSGNIFGRFWDQGEPIRLDGVRMLPPLMPSKVVGIGSTIPSILRRWDEKNPDNLSFLKPNTSVIGHGDG